MLSKVILGTQDARSVRGTTSGKKPHQTFILAPDSVGNSDDPQSSVQMDT